MANKSMCLEFGKILYTKYFMVFQQIGMTIVL